MYRTRIRYHPHRVEDSEVFPPGTTLYVPSMKVELINKHRKVSTVALLDTGAMTCVFPISYGEQLGLNPSNLPRCTIGGFGGSAPAAYAKVSLDFGGIWRVRTLVGFSEAMEELGYGVLGGLGFFEKFHMLFAYDARSVILTTNLKPRTKKHADELLVK